MCCLALLMACGGESASPPEATPPVSVDATPASVPAAAVPEAVGVQESMATAPDDRDTHSLPVADEPAPVETDVLERAAAWLADDSPALAHRALDLLLRSAPGDEDSEAAETLAGQAAAGLIEWSWLGFAHGTSAPAEQELPLLQRWNAGDARVVALGERLDRERAVQRLLAEAEKLAATGARMPPGENALEILREARRLAPNSGKVAAAFASLRNDLLHEARQAAKEDNFALAEQRLAQAVQVEPGSVVVQDVAARVVELRDQRTREWRSRIAAALAVADADAAQELLPGLEAVTTDERDVAWARDEIRRVRLYGVHDAGRLLVDPLADGGSGPGMVVIPAGSFQMGSPRNDAQHEASETPRHPVGFARGFALSRTEITVAQFGAFVAATGYRTTAERKRSSIAYDERSGALVEKRGTSWRNDYAGQPAADDLPVVHVSWSDAEAYAAWLSDQTGQAYRLPSEAEFEYALRADSKTRYPWGDGSPSNGPTENLTGARDVSPSDRRWSNAFADYGDGYWGPAPVASFVVNAFGLSDMNGNVSEWVADCWHESYARAPRDGSAWINPGCKDRVVRGASWASSPSQARSAFRTRAPATTRNARVGFRVARDLQFNSAQVQ